MKKQNILVAGYGNIGKALERVAQNLHLDFEFNFVDCLLNGSIEEYFSEGKIHPSTKVLINLTGLPSNKILLLCNQYGLDYIDTGVEVNHSLSEENVFEAFNTFRNTKLDIKAIIGAGMNPGIVEIIYGKYKPVYYHSAIVFEKDSAECLDSRQIFNTWSPSSFHSEFCVDNTFYYDKGPIFLEQKAKQTSWKYPFFSSSNRFYLVPHEETISIAQSNEKCILSGFLYSPPKRISDFFASHSQHETEKIVASIPVYHNIVGEDCVGILIHNEEHPNSLYHYYYNRANHQKIYNRFGVNGTSWQVVCGILSAIHILHSLPKKGVYTMTDIAYGHCDAILGYLETLDFYIERTDFTFEDQLIKRSGSCNSHVLF